MKEKFLSELRNHFKHTPTSGQNELMRQISTFLLSETQDELFLIKGYAGTGKTSLISAVIKSLKVIKYQSVLLAPTGRAAKVLSTYSGKVAFTIHKKIYKPVTNAQGYGSFILQPNLHKNTLFIVDEASMIGDGSNSGEGKLLGSRSLLEDLMSYVYNGENCKLILIGDTAQLPPVGMTESPALNCAYLQSSFHYTIHQYELTEVVRQALSSGILNNATALRNMIRHEQNKTPEFHIKNYTDIINLPGSELVDTINQCYRDYGDDNTIIICRSNKRANIYNQEIRKRIKFHEESISTGDYLMVVKNNYYWLNNKDRTSFIANGDIAEIVRIRKRDVEIFGFLFADVVLRLIDYPEEPEFEAKIILNTLTSEAPALTSDQNHKLFNEVMAYYSDIKSKAARLLKVKQDPFFNALQVKFAYAVTCHKAQGGQWKAAFVEQGYLTDEMMDTSFKRWLYTALTRAVEKLYLVNFNKRFFPEFQEE